MTVREFLIGDSNRLATMALRDLAGPAALEVQVVVVSAAGPWGKSRLLDDLAEVMTEQGRHFAKLGAAEIAALAENPETPERRALDETEMILVDDIHFLEGNPAAQNFFVQVFDQAMARKARLAIASSRPPRDLAGLSDALRSRLGWGLLLAIGHPELELCRELAARLAEQAGLTLPQEILDRAAWRCAGDFRHLKGLISTLAWMAEKTGRPVGEAAAALLPERAPGRRAGFSDVFDFEEILSGVAAAFGLKPTDLKAGGRVKRLAWPRRVAMYLARDLTAMTTTEIGRALGGRDHSTVIHGLKKIHEELKTPAQAQLVDNIRRALLSGL